MSKKQDWTSPYPRAREAQHDWGALSVSERAGVLQSAADFIADHLDELADVIHDENGKPVVEAIGHELLPAIAYVRWLGEEAPEILAAERRAVKWLPQRKCVVERRPFGAVLVISPWNIPFLIPFSQVLAALAAGNAVVLKPSEVTPVCATWIAKALDACGLPDGLFDLQMGDGALGARLIEERPDKVLFTGSVATGQKVMAACARQSIPVELEQGGIDAAIVCADADLDYAASAVAWGSTFNHGQVCASVERLLVEESVFDEFLERVTDKMEQINPYDDLSRVTFEGQSRVLDRHREDAKERDLTVHIGGEWLEEGKFSPTLYSGEGMDDAEVWNEETFGPMLAARPFATDGEAIELHNATRFGLTASVFSGDLDRAGRIARQLRAGNVSINDLGALHYSQPELPWGGVGESGFGRSHGPEGLLGLTWPQVIDSNRLGSGEPKRPWWYPYDHRQSATFAGLARLVAAKSAGDRAKWLGRTAARLTALVTGKPRN